jgi:hypothetical protein
MVSPERSQAEQLVIPPDASREVLKHALEMLVKGGDVPAEKVNTAIQISSIIHARAIAASEIKLSVEQAELLTKMEVQYPAMQAAFDKFHISTKGMPEWEQVKKGLTPQVLEKALLLKEPALLLVPPTPRKSKVKAINKHPVQGQEYDISTCELKNDDLWNGGRSKTEHAWRVCIADGVQDVAQDPEIYDGIRTNYDMSKASVKKLEDQGLDMVNDADVYLCLLMRSLVEGKPIDTKTYTVLNGKNLKESDLIALGRWEHVRAALSSDFPDVSSLALRLRGLVEVHYAQAA